jgi:hypothetical protein
MIVAVNAFSSISGPLGLLAFAPFVGAGGRHLHRWHEAATDTSNNARR